MGNTIYFDMPPDEFAYWNTDDAGRAMVQTLIQSGHIDCLHSYGDFATTREHAGAALDELVRHGCRIEVWVDHRVAPTNFGADIMQGSGDVPGAAAYHADLTCGYGVQYVWRGRVTSVIGQDVPRELGGIFTTQHVRASTKTLAKELAKGVLGRGGHPKYLMHGANKVLRSTRLRDGHPVFEFMRSNPYWGGVENADTADGLVYTLTPATLSRLLAREGVSIFYTHLGKGAQPEEPLHGAARQALRALAELFRGGKLLVTTTRRLLGYRRAVREVGMKVEAEPRALQIQLSTDTNGRAGMSDLSVTDLNGLTFYVPDPERTRITINGREVQGLRRNHADHTGRRSVSLPWPPLEFPSL